MAKRTTVFIMKINVKLLTVSWALTGRVAGAAPADFFELGAMTKIIDNISI